MTLVVIKNGTRLDADGGEVCRWTATIDELRAAIARGEVALFDSRRCPSPSRCPDCDRNFITARALDAHRADTSRRPGRGCHTYA